MSLIGVFFLPVFIAATLTYVLLIVGEALMGVLEHLE